MKNKYSIDVFIPVKVVQREKVTLELESKDYISKKLQQIRKDKKISQEDLAKSIGITRTSLSNIEGGRQSLSLKLLESICDTLKCKSTDVIPF